MNKTNVFQFLSKCPADQPLPSLPLLQGWRNRGGGGGPWPPPPPPQKSEWEGQGMFWPPQNFDHWPSLKGASGGQIASEHSLMGKIFKIFRLRRAVKRRTYLSGDFKL